MVLPQLARTPGELKAAGAEDPRCRTAARIDPTDFPENHRTRKIMAYNYANDYFFSVLAMFDQPPIRKDACWRLALARVSTFVAVRQGSSMCRAT